MCLCPHVVTVASNFCCWRSGVAFVHLVACVSAISYARAVTDVSTNAGVTALVCVPAFAGVSGDAGIPKAGHKDVNSLTVTVDS